MVSQYHVYFSGLVQGVGFRYTARDMARDLHLVGWVRNIPDGRVEMLVEGDDASIEELFKRLEKTFSISDKIVDRLTPRGQFVDFLVAF